MTLLSAPMVSGLQGSSTVNARPIYLRYTKSLYIHYYNRIVTTMVSGDNVRIYHYVNTMISESLMSIFLTWKPH